MPADPDARRAAFAAFVRRALRHAQTGRGWSIPRVAQESGVGVNTLYAWSRGSWKEYPKGELVERFCDTLGIPVDVALKILWPGSNARPAEPDPLPAEPDLVLLARKLQDPAVPESEKYLIREMIRSLAARPVNPSDAPGRRKTG